MHFKSPQEVQGALNLNQEQFNQLQTFVALNVPVLRVTSVGTAGKAKRTVQMVFRRVGVAAQLITWKEF